jgi:glycosyltransferase involved in cell wall biosynthesis
VRALYIASFPRAGTVTHVKTLAPSVAATGVDVHVVCANERLAGEFRRAGVEATVLELRHKADLANAARMRRLLAGADVVHTHDRRAGLLARPLARVLGTRVVETFHGVPEDLAPDVGRGSARGDQVPLRRLVRYRGSLALEALLARLGRVIVPSHALADYLLRHGFPVERTRVIPYGIDIRRREPPPPQERFTVATSAYLIPRKGIDVLIAAAARAASRPRVDVYGDGPLRRELEEQARTLDVDVRFHGEVADVRERLEQADVFVLPTRGDNLPVAILEAMAAALPVVSSRVGGVPELVAHGETGLLVDADDPDELARALDELASDRARREAFGRNAATRAAERFEAGVVARAVVGLYEEMAA